MSEPVILSRKQWVSVSNELDILRAKVAELETEIKALIHDLHAYMDTANAELNRAEKAEAKVAELETSAMGGYEDGWHSLRNERDELRAKVAELEASCDALHNYISDKDIPELEAKVAELQTENNDLMTISIPELQLNLKDAQAKVAELEAAYARWKADWVDIDKTREAKVAELEAERDEWVKDNVKLEARITELEARERQKPAYHCPKCDSWFSENDVAKQ